MQSKDGNSPLDELKATVSKWLFLDDDRLIDFIMAVYAANLYDSDPLWALIVGPPSHAKTELLRALDQREDTYFLSTITPRTLVSGKIVKKGKPNPSLIFKLTDKLVVLKDFTSILSMRADSQREILGQLREIYDGAYDGGFGTGEPKVTWRGRIGLIGATTPVYDSHHAVIGSMGERFILYRLTNGNEQKAGERAQEIVGRETEMRDEIRAAFHGFMDQVRDLIPKFKGGCDDVVKEMLVSLAIFCAHGRCPVDRDWRTGEVRYLPEPEGPPRLVKQLTQVATGLALVQGKEQIDIETFEVVKKIGKDLLPSHRLKICEYLWRQRAFDFTEKYIRTRDIGNATGIISKTAGRALEDLMLSGVVVRRQEGQGENSPYFWALSNRIISHIEGADVFETTDQK